MDKPSLVAIDTSVGVAGISGCRGVAATGECLRIRRHHANGDHFHDAFSTKTVKVIQQSDSGCNHIHNQVNKPRGQLIS